MLFFGKLRMSGTAPILPWKGRGTAHEVGGGGVSPSRTGGHPSVSAARCHLPFQGRIWWLGASLLLLAGCQKSFDDRYAEAQKQIGEQAVSIDRELAGKASEAAAGEADSGVTADIICPAVTKGWLQTTTPPHLATMWLLEVRRDGALRWGDQPLARGALARHLRDANQGTVPPPVLFVRVDEGVDCKVLQGIKNEVTQHFGCEQDRCLVPRPKPVTSTGR